MFKTGDERRGPKENRSITGAVDMPVETERSRFSPTPLAGMEPLTGHAIDPDADETSLDEALRSHAVENEQGAAAPAPALEPATLAEQRGLGILRLVWNSEGEVIETMGSWRPLEGIDEIPPTGTQARYVGSLYVDGGRSVPIDTEVVISGGGTYIDLDDNEVTLVRFDAPSLVADSRFARA